MLFDFGTAVFTWTVRPPIVWVSAINFLATANPTDGLWFKRVVLLNEVQTTPAYVSDLSWTDMQT